MLFCTAGISTHAFTSVKQACWCVCVEVGGQGCGELYFECAAASHNQADARLSHSQARGCGAWHLAFPGPEQQKPCCAC